MMKQLQHYIKQLDRLLPALLFTFLLSIQGLVSSGAANGISFPELIGPDGRVLTFVDLCNATGGDKKASDHCASCLSSCSAPYTALADISFAFETDTAPFPGASSTSISRPELSSILRRAPPAT